jgi:hypothetical protein
MSTEVKQQLDWRRSKVLELSSQGYSEREISEILEVSDSSVQRLGIRKTISIDIFWVRYNKSFLTVIGLLNIVHYFRQG